MTPAYTILHRYADKLPADQVVRAARLAGSHLARQLPVVPAADRPAWLLVLPLLRAYEAQEARVECVVCPSCEQSACTADTWAERKRVECPACQTVIHAALPEKPSPLCRVPTAVVKVMPGIAMDALHGARWWHKETFRFSVGTALWAARGVFEDVVFRERHGLEAQPSVTL